MDKKLDKDMLIYRIAKLIIELAKVFHDPEKDPAVELYRTDRSISEHIEKEMECIRMRERGEIA